MHGFMAGQGHKGSRNGIGFLMPRAERVGQRSTGVITVSCVQGRMDVEMGWNGGKEGERERGTRR